jgi:tRNA(Ile)-lysidine synthase
MSLRRQFQHVLDTLPAVHAAPCSLVAYSGGLDSHSLLHLCHATGLVVRAVHIHHGLQAEADSWDRHCADVCRQLDIPYTCIHVDAKPASGQSPEDAARNARYRALENELRHNEVLLTAHHQDDQAETVLLQLLRGAGPAGLAAMPLCKTFGQGFHVRPLLQTGRQQLRQYAQEQQLHWVDDPSNADTSVDRNYLRRQVVPALTENWPNAHAALSNVATLQQDALENIEAMAAIDLAALAAQQANSLSITKLRQLPRARRYNVLRYWIINAGYDQPRRSILHEILNNVLPAADDAAPLVLWGTTEVRRYQDTLYILQAAGSHPVDHVYAWDGEQALSIDSLKLELRLEQTQGRGMKQDDVAKGMTVRFRQGGEQLQPIGRRHTHSLKKLMQEAGIPPWQRNRIPLIYIDHQLACVCGYWVARAFAVSAEQCGWTPLCQRVHPLIRSTR